MYDVHCSQVLNDETFAILVLMALFTTFITTPTVMAIQKSAGGNADSWTAGEGGGVIGVGDVAHAEEAPASKEDEFKLVKESSGSSRGEDSSSRSNHITESGKSS